MSTSSNIIGVLLGYFCSLIIPYHIALITLLLRNLIPNREIPDISSDKLYNNVNFPLTLIINQYLDERKKVHLRTKTFFVLLSIWRLILSSFYFIILIGMLNWTIVLWGMRFWIASVLTACITILILLHLVGSWRFGNKLVG